jgi:dephospho-CoA kinase
LAASRTVIGVVGRVGSGKTTFARALGRKGAQVMHADEMAHALLRQPDTKRAVVAAFGVEVLGETGQVDRAAVAEVVFGDGSKLRTLNRLIHPGVREAVLREAERQDPRPLVIDAPLLFEGGLAGLCDRIVFVDAPARTCARRLAETRNWSQQEVDRRQQFQRSDRWKMNHSDTVVRNTGSEGELIDEARRFWRGMTDVWNRTL